MSTASLPQDDLDFERIVIYPRDLDAKTRHRLYSMLRKLGIRFEAGYWD